MESVGVDTRDILHYYWKGLNGGVDLRPEAKETIPVPAWIKGGKPTPTGTEKILNKAKSLGVDVGIVLKDDRIQELLPMMDSDILESIWDHIQSVMSLGIISQYMTANKSCSCDLMKNMFGTLSGLGGEDWQELFVLSLLNPHGITKEIVQWFLDRGCWLDELRGPATSSDEYLPLGAYINAGHVLDQDILAMLIPTYKDIPIHSAAKNQLILQKGALSTACRCAEATYENLEFLQSHGFARRDSDDDLTKIYMLHNAKPEMSALDLLIKRIRIAENPLLSYIQSLKSDANSAVVAWTIGNRNKYADGDHALAITAMWIFEQPSVSDYMELLDAIVCDSCVATDALHMAVVKHDIQPMAIPFLVAKGAKTMDWKNGYPFAKYLMTADRASVSKKAVSALAHADLDLGDLHNGQSGLLLAAQGCQSSEALTYLLTCQGPAEGLPVDASHALFEYIMKCHEPDPHVVGRWVSKIKEPMDVARQYALVCDPDASIMEALLETTSITTCDLLYYYFEHSTTKTPPSRAFLNTMIPTPEGFKPQKKSGVSNALHMYCRLAPVDRELCIEIVQWLMDAHCRVAQVDEKGMKSLWYYLIRPQHDLKMMELLWEEKILLNEALYDKPTSYCTAAHVFVNRVEKEGQKRLKEDAALPILEWLIAKGCDPQIPDYRKLKPIQVLVKARCWSKLTPRLLTKKKMRLPAQTLLDALESGFASWQESEEALTQMVEELMPHVPLVAKDQSTVCMKIIEGAKTIINDHKHTTGLKCLKLLLKIINNGVCPFESSQHLVKFLSVQWRNLPVDQLDTDASDSILSVYQSLLSGCKEDLSSVRVPENTKSYPILHAIIRKFHGTVQCTPMAEAMIEVCPQCLCLLDEAETLPLAQYLTCNAKHAEPGLLKTLKRAAALEGYDLNCLDFEVQIPGREAVTFQTSCIHAFLLCGPSRAEDLSTWQRPSLCECLEDLAAIPGAMETVFMDRGTPLRHYLRNVASAVIELDSPYQPLYVLSGLPIAEKARMDMFENEPKSFRQQLYDTCTTLDMDQWNLACDLDRAKGKYIQWLEGTGLFESLAETICIREGSQAVLYSRDLHIQLISHENRCLKDEVQSLQKKVNYYTGFNGGYKRDPMALKTSTQPFHPFQDVLQATLHGMRATIHDPTQAHPYLRRLFDALDRNQSQTLSRNEFDKLYTQLDTLGVVTDLEPHVFLNRFGLKDAEALAFEEFVQVMMSIAKR